jgi:hypothetical protein
MSRIVLRVVLAGLLLAGVAGKLGISAEPGRDDVGRAVLRVLNEHGFSAWADVSKKRSELLPVAVQLQAPGCDGPIEIVPVNINLQEAPLFGAEVRPDYTRQFAYLDGVWSKEDRLGLRLRWVKYKALSALGLSRFVAISTGLLVASPPGCHLAQTIDWSMVWDRRTIAATKATANLF